MKKTLIVLALLGIVVGFGASVSAQLNMQGVKETVIDSLEVDRKALITLNVNLTEDEGKAFWPVYNLYRSDVKEVNSKLFALIQKYAENYETLTDEKAAELMTEAMSIEEDRVILKQVYVKDLVEILPMKKVAVLFQLENKINASVMYELAQQIPMVEVSDDSPVGK